MRSSREWSEPTKNGLKVMRLSVRMVFFRHIDPITAVTAVMCLKDAPVR